MNTEDRIREFIRDTFFVDDVDRDASFLETGVIDSTGMIELVSFLQKAFEIEVADAELLPDNLDSLARVSAFVDRKRTLSREGERPCAE